ncbi:leucine-rich repeat protein [bacterium]|nr:leucine-rich repeat protein [bacterium]
MKKLFILSLITFCSIYISAESYILQTADLAVSEDGMITDCSYDFSNTDITIPDAVNGITITGIADVNVFGSVEIFYAQGITNVVFPSTITSIGDNAFKSNDLTALNLPSSLKNIGSSAFSNNNRDLKTVDIPSGVSFIGDYAFTANGIDSLILPTPVVPGFMHWVNGVGNQYEGGTKLKYTGTEFRAIIAYTLQDEDVEMNEVGMISSCSYDFEYTDILIPESLDETVVTGILGKSFSGVFEDKDITSLQLPSTLLYIGDGAFNDNDLSDITIPEGVTFIGSKAFASNSMESIDIPNSVTYIGQQAFWGIDSFTLPTPSQTGFEFWISTDGTTHQGGVSVEPGYNGFEAKIVYILTDDDVTITDGIIESCSYDYTSKYIKIPEMLKDQQVVGIADGEEVTFYNYVGVFSEKEIKDVQLPTALATIGDYAFYDNELTSLLTLPSNVKYIGMDAFTRNTDFEGVVLPSPENDGSICENWKNSAGSVFENGVTISNFYEKSYTAQFTTGLLSAKLSVGSFKIFPNPAKEYINIDLDAAFNRIEILTINGVVVYSDLIQGDIVDVSNLAKGIYLVKVSNDNTMLQSRFLKQ